MTFEASCGAGAGDTVELCWIAGGADAGALAESVAAGQAHG
ncbi:hypothetical protein ACIPC1_09505 [Streptomyces sp. NPDC087263]